MTEMEKKNLIKDICLKAERGKLNYANLSLDNAYHFNELHVGLSNDDLRDRALFETKDMVSTIKGQKAFDRLIKEYFSDKYNIEKEIIPYLCDESQKGRKKMPEYYPDMENFGTVYVKSERRYYNAENVTFVIQKTAKPSKITGLPFRIITVYVGIDEDEL